MHTARSVHACLHPARDLSCALRAYERHLTTRGAAWQVLVYGIIEHLDGTIMRQEKEIEDRDFLAAKTMALLGTLLAHTQPAAVPVLEQALPTVSVPQ